MQTAATARAIAATARVTLRGLKIASETPERVIIEMLVLRGLYRDTPGRGPGQGSKDFFEAFPRNIGAAQDDDDIVIGVPILFFKVAGHGNPGGALDEGVLM